MYGLIEIKILPTFVYISDFSTKRFFKLFNINGSDISSNNVKSSTVRFNNAFRNNGVVSEFFTFCSSVPFSTNAADFIIPCLINFAGKNASSLS